MTRCTPCNPASQYLKEFCAHFLGVLVLLAIVVGVLLVCHQGGSDAIADHQAGIIELREDATFTVEGANVRSGKAKAERVTSRLTTVPPLKPEDVRLIRDWMVKSIDVDYVSCAVLPEGTLDILALEVAGNRTICLHKAVMCPLQLASNHVVD